MRIERYITRQIVAVLVILIAACQSPLAWADDHKPLLFLCDKNYAPMTYLDNGQPKGVVVDIIAALGQRLQRQVIIQPMEWSKAQDQVLAGKADALCQLSMTEQRKTLYDFSDPIITLHFAIFTRADKPELSELADLHGLKAGATAGSLPYALLKTDSQINVVRIDDYLQGFQMLKANQLDAILLDRWVGSYLLAEQGISEIQPSEDNATRLPSSIAVKRGNEALLALINHGLAALKADGTLERIYAAWRPKEVVMETREQATRKIYYFSLAILVILLIGTTAWVITMKREVAERTRSEEALKNNRERLTKLSAHIEHIKEQQRVRISREIHDDLGGNLVAIKMVLHTVLNRQAIDFRWLSEKIKYIETLIDRTIDAGHRIVLELRPGVLDMGIIAAIEWLTHEFEKQNSIPCVFSSNSPDIPILPGHAAAIFRMVQEALTNVAKHAQASQVVVTVVSTDESISVMIGDNGRGLEKGHENKPNSFGLLGMAERCKEIGGTVWIESKPENGCVVTIKIPL